MNPTRALIALLFGFCFCSCKDATRDSGITNKDWQKLEKTDEIATEIQQAYKIQGHPYYRIHEEAGQIELQVTDPTMDHATITKEISDLPSVRAYSGKLYVVFRHPPEGAEPPTMWIKYDAKTGQEIQQ